MPDPTPSTVTAPDGAALVCYRWTGEAPPTGIVQLTHGMGEHALRYAWLAGRLNDAGFVVYAQDHRGHGATAASPERHGVLGPDGWQRLVDDLDVVRDHALAEHPGLPLVLLGHSMGSFALQQYLLDRSDRVDAAVLTGTTALDLLEPAIDLDAPVDLSAFNAPFAPARTDYDWLSRDEAQVDRYVADPACGFGLDAESGRGMFAGARAVADPQRLRAVRSDLPLYVASGELDPVHGQQALLDALVERYRAAGLTRVEVRVYPQARHEIVNETNREEVVEDLLAWLAGAVPRRG